MDWEKIKVPREELNVLHISEPKLMTPERQRARLRPMLGIPGANFIGKRNHSKVRVLILLYNTQNNFLSAVQIAEESGISYDYCRNRLRFWFKWGYLKSYLEKTKFDRARKYAISKKGLRYLEKVPAHIAREIMAELEDYRIMAENTKRILKD